MFSLIITIISIALVVALVAATMYHGGDVLTQGRTEADAAAFVAGAQQITGAASMHLALEGTAALGDGAAGIKTALVDTSYLSSVPSVEGEWISLTANSLVAEVTSDDVCTALAGDASDTYTCAAATVANGALAVGDNQFTFKY